MSHHLQMVSSIKATQRCLRSHKDEREHEYAFSSKIGVTQTDHTGVTQTEGAGVTQTGFEAQKERREVRKRC